MEGAPLNVEHGTKEQITFLIVAALKQAASVTNGVQVTDHLLDALRALDGLNDGSFQLRAPHRT